MADCAVTLALAYGPGEPYASEHIRVATVEEYSAGQYRVTSEYEAIPLTNPPGVQNFPKLSVFGFLEPGKTEPRFKLIPNTASADYDDLVDVVPVLGAPSYLRDDVIDGVLNDVGSDSRATVLELVDGAPVGDATQTALDGKVPTSRTVNGHALTANVTVTKSDVGLSAVDNTADTAKPVSALQQAAIDDEANDRIAGDVVNANAIDELAEVVDELALTGATDLGVSSRVETGPLSGAAVDERVEGWTGLTHTNQDSSALAHAFRDQEDRSAGGIRKDLSVAFTRLVPDRAMISDLLSEMVGDVTRSDPTKIACLGDSLTRGTGIVGGDWALSDAWPAQLEDDLTGVTVTNLGNSGWCIDEMAILFGALPVSLSVASDTIPASGAVAVTTTQIIGWTPGSTRAFLGSLTADDGTVIPGTLTKTASAFTFTRTTGGTAKAASGLRVFTSDVDVHAADTLILLAGRNDVSQAVTGADGTVVDHVINTTRKIVDHLTPLVKQVLICGTVTRSNERGDSDANHVTVMAINDALKARYPARFADLQDYLVNDLLTDMGLTPSVDDLAAIAGYTRPPQTDITATDYTHWSIATAHQIAVSFYAPLLTARKWV